MWAKRPKRFAKKKHPREVANLYSTNKQVFHPVFAQEKEIANIQRGRNFSPRAIYQVMSYDL
jgi:hypothetical protein